MRAALDDATTERLAGCGGVAAVPRGRRAAAGRWGGWARRLPPVGGPLPDVARHVEQAVAVGREAAHGRGAGIAVELEVLPGELALPRVGPLLAVGVGL